MTTHAPVGERAPTTARRADSTRVAIRADFPILRARLRRPAAGLPGLAPRPPQAARRHRCRGRLQQPRTSPTSTAASTRSASERPRPTRRRAAAVARFINAADAHEIVFVRNATEAINLVAYSWGRRNIGRGDTIVLTEMEHHANLVPWQLLAQEQDARPGVHAHRRRRPPRSRRRTRSLLRTQAQARRLHPRLEHARHDQPGARDGGDGPRRRRAGPGRRRAGGAAPAGRRRRPWAATSTSSAATRCWARPARARSGRGASCSRRCRRSWPAAR